MHNIFITIYSILKTRKKSVFTFLFLMVALIVLVMRGTNLEEDISSLIPMDERISEMSETFTNSKFADQIVFTLYLHDTAQINQNRLIEVADSLGHFLSSDSVYVQAVRSSVDEASISKVYDFFYNNMPLYMSDEDYAYLDTITTQENLDALMQKNYRSIIGPTGFATSKFILKDPLSIVPRLVKRLQSFQLDDNFVLYKSHIFTKDKKKALVFIDPSFSSKNTKQNRILIAHIDDYLLNHVPDDVKVEYYGGTAVAVANANRVQKDIILTVSIAAILLVLLFAFVFRNIKVLVVLFLPVVLGVAISLVVLSFMYTSISVIALGVGAVLLGVSVDYSLHYFSHVRIGHSPKQILKAISAPMIMSSLTTASAFMCLSVVNSPALNQLGLFAGLSVVAASLFVLLLLPLLFNHGKSELKENPNTLIDKFATYDFHKHKGWIIGVLVLSVVFVFTAQSLRFDADIANLNYMPVHLAQAEANLKKVSSEASSAIYVVVSDTCMDAALLKLERNAPIFKTLADNNIVGTQSGVGTLLLSGQKQKAQIDRWNAFWLKKGLEPTLKSITEAGENNHFKAGAFSSFVEVAIKDYSIITETEFSGIIQIFLSNLINTKEGRVSLVSVCKVSQDKKDDFFKAMSTAPDLLVLDKQFFTNKFFEILKEDFSKLINYSMVVVFLIVLLFWGRIELALITFVPVVLSWYWTIGLMGLFDVHFNIFNIIICTFIFGLGVDYSIFIMQGLINNHKYGNHSIHPYKVSILLSICTTLIGVGVLIFAQHPALRSIATVTILGMVSVILITFTILPFLFNWMVNSKNGKRIFPVILLDIMVSIVSFAIFLVGVIFLSALVLVFKLTPFFSKAKKKIIHYLLFLICKLVVGINFLFKIEYIDKHKFNLSKPAVIICNHQSHLDIALILLMSPKIIVLTNEWVWKNPFYGFIIRYINFYPIYTGIDNGYDKIKAKVNQGYSVLVFPEGTRTKDGRINRFHQGAFSLADYLGLDILPIVLHGAFECLPKTEFFLRAGDITLKFYDRIKVDKVSISEGITYRPQAKGITTFYRNEYALLKEQVEDVSFFSRRLINQYVYKGPVLEWYMRIKLSIEKKYRFYDELLPKQGKIIDVGCGYGFMANLLSYTSPERVFVGWDYDQEKIRVAQEVARYRSKVTFEVKDIVTNDFEQADVFVFNDVLHYLSESDQFNMLRKALSCLNYNGMMVIRDADTELKRRTKFTKLTELFSIKLMRFNKLKYELSFISSSKIEAFAKDNNLSFEKIDNAKYTSNLTYILKKEE